MFDIDAAHVAECPSQQSLPTPVDADLELGPKQVLYLEGDPAVNVYRVRSGAIAECIYLRDGRRQIVAIHLPGDIVGITNGATYEFTATATCPTRVEAMPSSQLASRLERERGPDAGVLNRCIRRLSESRAHIVQLGRMSAMERVAMFLLRMEMRIRERCKTDNTLWLPMSRVDIGDYLGLSLETVSRVFSALKNRKLIALSDPQSVSILDRDGLVEEACGRTGTIIGASANDG